MLLLSMSTLSSLSFSELKELHMLPYLPVGSVAFLTSVQIGTAPRYRRFYHAKTFPRNVLNHSFGTLVAEFVHLFLLNAFPSH